MFNINIRGINVGVSFCCYIKCRSLHSCSHYDYIASGHHLCLTKILLKLKIILKHEKNYDNLCFFFPFSPPKSGGPGAGIGPGEGTISGALPTDLDLGLWTCVPPPVVCMLASTCRSCQVLQLNMLGQLTHIEKNWYAKMWRNT